MWGFLAKAQCKSCDIITACGPIRSNTNPRTAAFSFSTPEYWALLLSSLAQASEKRLQPSQPSALASLGWSYSRSRHHRSKAHTKKPARAAERGSWRELGSPITSSPLPRTLHSPYHVPLRTSVFLATRMVLELSRERLLLQEGEAYSVNQALTAELSGGMVPTTLEECSIVASWLPWCHQASDQDGSAPQELVSLLWPPCGLVAQPLCLEPCSLMGSVTPPAGPCNQQHRCLPYRAE